ncbi:MAG TPA: CmcJ/NvfI family oxidoreductase [Ramlibacter sp.]|nr:CmcJ/NvfI family oxidoreductase [Ramlibacter sp.]
MSAIPMAAQAVPPAALPHVTATINYAGPMDGRPLFDLLEPSRTNLNFEPHTVRIHDVRGARDRFSLDVEGFAFIDCPSRYAGRPEMRDLNMTHQVQGNEVNRAYHAEVAERLKALTGAREIVAQTSGLIVRTTGGAKKQSWAGPATFVHLDYTPKTAKMFLDIALREEDRQVADYRRFAVYQTWRAISPTPQPNTLAVCDGRSVPPSDAIVWDNRLGPEEVPGTCFESRLCRGRDSHQWYYLSNMTMDDLLVFKGFDSDAPEAMNAMHTSFDHPDVPAGAAPRESLESRFFAFYD